MTTRSWEGEKGRGSTAQIRAFAVGPNLKKGTAEFKRAARPTVEPAPVPGAVPGEEFVEPADESGVGDYPEGDSALYELNSDDAVPEPALH
jgi:single-strand DNA-binding protein